MDVVLGVATGWLWDDFGFAAVKQGCQDAEAFIAKWNDDLRSRTEKDEDMDLVLAVPLRRSGYLSLDIQIPDPRVGTVEETDGQGKEHVTESADAGPT